MMKFTGLWTPAAEQRLAAVWIDTTDRQSIVEAAAKIDSLLESSPLECGESRTGSLRIGFVSPLGFDFEVSPQEGRVYVLAVWKIGRR